MRSRLAYNQRPRSVGRPASIFFVSEKDMSRSVICIIWLFVFQNTGAILVGPAAAQSEAGNLRYISDLLVINIRDQLEKPFTVVGVVRSGDAVHIVEEQDNFYKIKTADNKEGWIGKQYLKTEAPDSVTVKKLREEVADLKKQLEAGPAGVAATATPTENGKDTADSCGPLQQKLNDAEKQIHQLQEQLKNRPATPGTPPDTVQEPELAAQLEQTSQRYNQLVVEYEKRGQEIAGLQNAIAKQDDTTRFLWFGAGAVVFFLGILAGRSAHRKKSKFLYKS